MLRTTSERSLIPEVQEQKTIQHSKPVMTAMRGRSKSVCTSNQWEGRGDSCYGTPVAVWVHRSTVNPILPRFDPPIQNKLLSVFCRCTKRLELFTLALQRDSELNSAMVRTQIHHRSCQGLPEKPYAACRTGLPLTLAFFQEYVLLGLGVSSSPPNSSPAPL